MVSPNSVLTVAFDRDCRRHCAGGGGRQCRMGSAMISQLVTPCLLSRTCRNRELQGLLTITICQPVRFPWQRRTGRCWLKFFDSGMQSRVADGGSTFGRCTQVQEKQALGRGRTFGGMRAGLLTAKAVGDFAAVALSHAALLAAQGSLCLRCCFSGSPHVRVVGSRAGCAGFQKLPYLQCRKIFLMVLNPLIKFEVGLLWGPAFDYLVRVFSFSRVLAPYISRANPEELQQSTTHANADTLETDMAKT